MTTMQAKTDAGPDPAPAGNGAGEAQRPRREKSAWWRAVLGEYPTGVTAITSTDANGDPIGMVVGTFTAVSESPALVGFLPGASSTTFEKIRENGTFCANVLGYEHEDLCRRFASRAEDRFAGDAWETSELGNQRLSNAVAWFEGRITDVTPVGDHFFVVAEVAGLGVGDGSAGLPLLFLKGGYGSFTVPSLSFDVPDFSGRLRAAENVRDVVQRLADETGHECLLSTVVDDSVLVLTAANLLPSRPRAGIVGMNFPFAAPLAPALAAWGPDERIKLWEENSRHLLGAVDRPLIGRLLESVREQGYATTTGGAMEEFDVVANNLEVSRSALAGVWAAVKADTGRMLGVGWPGASDLEPDAAAEPLPEKLNSLQFPVFDANGHAEFELVVAGFEDGFTQGEYRSVVERGLAAAAELTDLTGGRAPKGYRGRTENGLAG